MTEIEFKYIQEKEYTLAGMNSVKSYLPLAYS